MSETKAINKMLGRVLSMAVSLNAATKETMAAMITDDGDFVDQSNDETAYYELVDMQGQLARSIDMLGAIYKNRMQTQQHNQTK